MIDINKHKLTEELLFTFTATIKTNVLYDESHPKMKSSLNACSTILNDYTKKYGDLKFLIIGTEFIFEGIPFLRDNVTIIDLAKRFESFEIEKITIENGVTIQEIYAFVKLLSANPERVKNTGGVYEFLRKMGGTPHIKLFKLASDVYPMGEAFPVIPGRGLQNIPPDKVDIEKIGDINKIQEVLYEDLQKMAQSLYKRFLDTKEISRVEMENFSQIMSTKIIVSTRKLYGKNRIKTDIPIEPIAEHFLRVALVCVDIARSIKMPIKVIKSIVKGAFWHDIGFLSDTAKKDSYLLHPITGAILVYKHKELDINDSLFPTIIFEHHLSFEREKIPILKTALSPHPSSIIVSFCNILDNYLKTDLDNKEIDSFFDTDILSIKTDKEKALINSVKVKFLKQHR